MNLVQGQGLPDFIMLDNELVTEAGFMDNLRLRFDKKQIYTYIGEQLVAMNPFTPMNIYGKEVIDDYRNKYLYEVQPHIFSLGDDTFRALMQTKTNQCVIVTGESGAGKTEAAKIFLNYISAVSAGGAGAIKEKLLDSNPIMEAFGNAKTVRNDNSSRFGKYMEIQFNGAGGPVGGKISQYLLEKSRVITRAEGERSFHIFYELLTSDAKLLGELGLDKDASKYHYLNLSKEYHVDNMNDVQDFKDVNKSMNTLGFAEADKHSAWQILASILHLGNLKIEVDKSITSADASKVVDGSPELARVASLLKVEPALLARAFVSRKITTGIDKGQSSIQVLLNMSQAYSSRDSLSKALYNSLFNWVVDKVNSAILGQEKLAEVMIGVLDIYGFEIFETNSFEQFCINYLNEKLQQLFIQLVLKQEQEEYIREGITWKEIDYFNNNLICELIEGKSGIFRLLDEACMIGKATPKDLLDKFDQSFGKNNFYTSYGLSKDKTIRPLDFRMKHYAGIVDYNVEQFMDKNTDTLFRDLVEALQSSSDNIVKNFFPVEKEEPSKKGRDDKKKRPPTSGVQFMLSVNLLVEKLLKCEPHYIRCIKSNDKKKAFALDEERVKHQARYLNLVETVRVRRAGFCNKQHYERFLWRYKMVSPQTWPIWKGDHKAGCQAILDAVGVQADEYQKGKTKLFIRDAKTLFKMEEARAKHMPKVAVAITRRWKGWKQRIRFIKLRATARIQKVVRGFLARQRVRKMVSARTIQRVFRGHQARILAKNTKDRMVKKASSTKIQKVYRGHRTRKWYKQHLEQLKKEREEAIRKAKARLCLKLQSTFRGNEARIHHKRLRATIRLQRAVRYYWKRRYIARWNKNMATASPKSDKTNFGKAVAFPSYKPSPLAETEKIFAKWNINAWARRKVLSLSDSANKLMRQKVLTMNLFHYPHKKPWNTARPFTADYMSAPSNPLAEKFRHAIQEMFQAHGDTAISFADVAIKVNRKFKSQYQVIIVTDQNIYKYEPDKYKMIKSGTPLSAVTKIQMSTQPDSFVIVHCQAPYRDFVLDLGNNVHERYSELVTVLFSTISHRCNKDVPVEFTDTINCNNSREKGKDGQDIQLHFEPSSPPPKSPLANSHSKAMFVGKGNAAAIQFWK